MRRYISFSDHFFHISWCAQSFIFVFAQRSCSYLFDMLYFATRYKLHCITNHNSRQAAPLCEKSLSHAVYVQDKDNWRSNFRWDWHCAIRAYSYTWCIKPSRDIVNGHVDIWLVCDHTFFLWTLNFWIRLRKLLKKLWLTSSNIKCLINSHDDRRYTVTSALNNCLDCTSISQNIAQEQESTSVLISQTHSSVSELFDNAMMLFNPSRLTRENASVRNVCIVCQAFSSEVIFELLSM